MDRKMILALLAELGLDPTVFWAKAAEVLPLRSATTGNDTPVAERGFLSSGEVGEAILALGVVSPGRCMMHCRHPAVIVRGKAHWCAQHARAGQDTAPPQRPEPPRVTADEKARAVENKMWIRDYDKPLPVEWHDPRGEQ